MKNKSKIGLEKFTIAKIPLNGMNKIKGGTCDPSHIVTDISV